MKSNNITSTDNRLINALGNANTIANKSVVQNIQKTIESNKVRIGKVTKFFHEWGKAEVKLKNGEKILCKLLQMLGGDINLLFTPTGEIKFDPETNKIYIEPHAEMQALVLDISNNDSKEHLLLGYYSNHDLISYEAPTEGNLRFIVQGLKLDFGVNGFYLDATNYHVQEHPDGLHGVNKPQQSWREFKEELKEEILRELQG